MKTPQSKSCQARKVQGKKGAQSCHEPPTTRSQTEIAARLGQESNPTRKRSIRQRQETYFLSLPLNVPLPALNATQTRNTSQLSSRSDNVQLDPRKPPPPPPPPSVARPDDLHPSGRRAGARANFAREGRHWRREEMAGEEREEEETLQRLAEPQLHAAPPGSGPRSTRSTPGAAQSASARRCDCSEHGEGSRRKQGGKMEEEPSGKRLRSGGRREGAVGGGKE
eukprot:749671-Hanusia_phi.AAC.9